MDRVSLEALFLFTSVSLCLRLCVREFSGCRRVQGLGREGRGRAERLCSRVAVLQGGRIQQEGTVTKRKAYAAGQGATLEDVFLQLTGANLTPASPLTWY